MVSGHFGAALPDLRRLFVEGTATGLSDAQLVRRFVQSRDEAAFAARVARHGPMVVAVCRGILRNPQDVEDAFQATFLVLVRKARTLWVSDSLPAWLYQVSVLIAIQARSDTLRRREQARALSAAPPARRRRVPGAWMRSCPSSMKRLTACPTSELDYRRVKTTRSVPRRTEFIPFRVIRFCTPTRPSHPLALGH
jgi:Sigma-70 region 2